MNFKTKLSVIALVALLSLTALFCLADTSAPVAEAAGILDMVSPSVIRFYEDNIAHENFITSMTAARHDKLCRMYGVSGKRLDTLLVLQDLGARVDNPQSLSEMSKMTDNQVVSTGKTLIEAYVATLSPEEKEYLKQEFYAVLKNKNN